MEEQVPHVGLRAQKILPSGERPGILAEPGPQRSDRSRRQFSGDGLPQLPLPLLASSASEAVDASALAFLLSQSLAAKKHEEQKKREEEAKEALLAWSQRRGKDLGTRRTPLQLRRMVELAEEIAAINASQLGSSSASSSTRRKKKKRRKR